MRGVWINDTFHPDTGRRPTPSPVKPPNPRTEAQRYGNKIATIRSSKIAHLATRVWWRQLA